MIIVDTHCDTITKIMESGDNLQKNACHLDIERMKKYGSYVQFFAAFIDPIYSQAYSMRRAVQIIDKLYEQVELYKEDITLCCNYNDIMNAQANNRIAALLSIEGGEALQGDISALRMFYKLGVRSICLTWNHRNEIADGVKDASTNGGLTPFGRQVIREMNRLGMIIDVSHLSEKGFWDVIELSTSPIMASHSNTKRICSHARNLTDEQILAIKDNNGVIGINLYPVFLNDTGKADTTDIIRHIEHICSLAGIEHVGIGADFDGIEYTPEDIKGVQDLQKIFKELVKLNYSEDYIEMIAGKNFMRLIRSVL